MRGDCERRGDIEDVGLDEGETVARFDLGGIEVGVGDDTVVGVLVDRFKPEGVSVVWGLEKEETLLCGW